MPTSQLFGVNNSGHVFSLSTDQSSWREIAYIGIEFKRLASHESVIWALGGDHQVYVYVYGSSVPIRVCEESYENQRWNPMESFTSNLLPTDRAHFSSADGLTDRTLAFIHLPTLAWTWEGPWHLHDTFQGQALDKEAWTYSVDFPRSYSADKRWNSCVRRRKWVRYRRYVALDTWSAVPPIHQDHTKEPFIDISVGGGEVPGEDADKLMVWGVTALNRVMVREGVCGTCPEGVAWTHVPTPADQDVISVSVGRSGRVWAVTWDGVALVRSGISRDNPTGTEWRVVESPPEGCLQHIAVGVNVVWGLTREHKVWFRRGFTNDQGSPSKSANNKQEQKDVVHPSDDPGTSWLQMVGALNMISVGPNDQVWGVTTEDHIAVIRTGVTPQELAGRTWRSIALPLASELSPEPSPTPSPVPSPGLDSFRKQSLSALSTTDSHSSSVGVCESSSPSLIQEADVENMEAALSNLKTIGQGDGVTTQVDMKSDEGGGTRTTANVITAKEDIDQNNEGEKEIKEETKERDNDKDSESVTSQDLSVQIKYPEENSASLTSSVISDGTSDYLGVITAASSNSIPNNVVPVQSSHLDNSPTNVTSSGLKPEEDNSVTPETLSIDGRFRHESMSSVGSSTFALGSMVLPREELPTYTLMPMQEGHLWMWLTGGGCWTQANNMPKW